MKRLDRFIIKSFVGPFVAILLVVVFILVMQFLWLYIDELVGKGLSLKVILEFLGWGAATMLPLSLPLATLLASMMTLGTLGENNELLAIKAAGISLQRVLLPLSMICLIISVGAFFVSNDLLPVAYNKIYTLRDDIGKTKDEIKIPTGTFYNGIEGYILRVDENDDETGMMHGVMVYNHTKKKGNVSLTIADSAKMSMSKDKTYLTFTLYDGTNYEETNDKKYRDTTLQVQKIDFHKQSMIIPLENYAFQKSDSSRFDDQVKSMNLKQLQHGQDSIGALDAKGKKDNLDALRTSRLIRYNSQLDTSNKKMPTSIFSVENVGVWDDLQREITALEKAKNAALDLQMSFESYARERYRHNFTLRLIDIEILKKFALSIACLIFFFIGAPLGALIRKGGLGTPAIISVLFFVAYWVIDISGTKLARDGAVGPFFGVFFSSYVLLPTGLFLTWMAINDSAIFSAESLKNGFKKIKAKIMGYFKKTRIVYMGTPEFAVAPLDELIKSGYNIVGVVTVADKASGRGLKINESAVKKYAVEHNIPVLQPVSLKDPEFLQALQAWKADLFVVVAFRMLPKVVWSMPRLGTFNLHAALLPQYRGAAPINWAVINGETETGVTTFFLDHDIDTGRIIMQKPFAIPDDADVEYVYDGLMHLGAEIAVETIDRLIASGGNIDSMSQDEMITTDTVLHSAPKIFKDTCHIDFNQPAKKVYDFIRGLSPYPGAWTEIQKEGGKAQVLKVFKTSKTGKAVAGSSANAAAVENVASSENAASSVVGTLRVEGKSLQIACADEWLQLDTIQISGKKRMEARDFLNGMRDIEQYRSI